MYPEYMMESIKKVEATRAKRLAIAKKQGKQVYPPMNEQEREDILETYHPDYKKDALREMRLGVNKGEMITNEVVNIMESYPRNKSSEFDLSKVDYETDVLVIGAGSAGLSAAIEADRKGVNTLLVTKLRLGDSNSMMAQGGIQAADQRDDSPTLHYLDVIGGGHFDNKKELVEALVMDGPKSIKWLEDLGVMFDKDDDGRMTVKPGGGTCRNRMHSTRDYTGAGICRVLRDEVYSNAQNVKFLEYTSATELILDDKGQVAGAILFHIELKEYFIVKAKTVIIATGGFGRLHIRGFETTNHYGATGDGLVLGYRAGANLLFMDSVQYHPTGAVFPEQIVGFLCTEKIRSIGAQPINEAGELFVYPLEPRDVEASAFIRECEEDRGVTTPSGLKGIWLDSPLIEELSGEGTIETNLPAMLRQYERFDIDIRKYPMLVFPTLHYQNGGLEINKNAETSVPGLYVVGEASGGVHGRNRLMGNSQLDIIVFGRRAGIHAADKVIAGIELGNLTLKHVDEYAKEVDKLNIPKNRISPIILPDYIPDHVKAKQMTEEYLGTLVK